MSFEDYSALLISKVKNLKVIFALLLCQCGIIVLGESSSHILGFNSSDMVVGLQYVLKKISLATK
jgi:hypothetical protein